MESIFHWLLEHVPYNLAFIAIVFLSLGLTLYRFSNKVGASGTVQTIQSFSGLPFAQKIRIIVFFVGGMLIVYLLYLIALSVLIDNPPPLHNLTKISNSIINFLAHIGIVK